MYYLFESSVGFFLFKSQKIDTAQLTTKEVQKDMESYEKFKTMLSFENSLLFHGHNVAIDTIESLKTSQLPDNLSNFLKTSLKKSKNVKLGLQDKTLAGLILSKLKIKVSI